MPSASCPALRRKRPSPRFLVPRVTNFSISKDKQLEYLFFKS